MKYNIVKYQYITIPNTRHYKTIYYQNFRKTITRNIITSFELSNETKFKKIQIFSKITIIK